MVERAPKYELEKKKKILTNWLTQPTLQINTCIWGQKAFFFLIYLKSLCGHHTNSECEWVKKLQISYIFKCKIFESFRFVGMLFQGNAISY